MRMRVLRGMLGFAACLALAALAPPAEATPTSGGGRASCLGCHGTPREAAIPSLLQITARPGDLIPLTINLTNGADAYSASLTGLGAAGLAGFTPDADWANHFTAGTYNSDPQYGGPFYALSNSGVAYQGPVSHMFDLRLADNTQLGTYPMSFVVAGSGGGEQWRDVNPFSLTVIPEPATWALMTAGAIGGLVCCWRWRRPRRESG